MAVYSVSLSMYLLIFWCAPLTKGAAASCLSGLSSDLVHSGDFNLVDVLKEKLRKWEAWDSVTMIQRHHEIRIDLEQLFLYLQVRI